MTYEDLSQEEKDIFDELMNEGRVEEAMRFLHGSKPLTPEEQAEADKRAAENEKEQKKFSTFVITLIVLIGIYAVYTTVKG